MCLRSAATCAASHRISIGVSIHLIPLDHRGPWTLYQIQALQDENTLRMGNTSFLDPVRRNLLCALLETALSTPLRRLRVSVTYLTAE
jgi:hypothetical protein